MYEAALVCWIMHDYYLCGMLWCAAEKRLQAGIGSSTDTLLVTHSQQRGQRNCYRPGKSKTQSGICHKTCKSSIIAGKWCLTNLSNTCLMTRKQRAMGIVAQRSCVLGKTLPSWSLRSAHPCPWGNQIQSAHISSLSRDNILETKQKKNACFFMEGNWDKHQKRVLSAGWSPFRFSIRRIK